MIPILSAVLPVATIVAIGIWAGKTLSFDIDTLSRLILYVLFPVLITDSLYRTTLSVDNILGLAIGTTLTYFLLCAIAWKLGKSSGLSTDARKSFLATTAFPNAGNMGLPVTFFALGDAGLERGIVYMIISSIVVNTTGPAFCRGGEFWATAGFVLKLPLAWSIIIGLLLHFAKVELPLNLDESLHLLAQAAIPVALIVLGLQIANHRLQPTPYEGYASMMRLLGGAAIAYAVGKAIGLAELDFQVLVLQSAMPAAVSSFLMVKEFGGDAPRTAKVVVVSTLLAFGSLPLVLWILGV
ncbi:MAG: AEC family transporter [Geitlerinemataceae cyanobacterium]